MQRRVVQLTPVGPHRADRVDVRTGRQPLAEQHRRPRGGRDHHHVGPAYGLLRRAGGPHAVPPGEPIRVTRAPDPHVPERPHQSQGLEVTSRLHARAEDRERRRVRPGEELGRHRRHRGGPHLRDEPAIHRDEWLAGLGTKEQDQRVVRGDAAIVGKEGDQLGAERAGVGGHGGEEAALAGHLDHLAPGWTARPADRSASARAIAGNEVLHPQAPPHGVLVEDHRCIIRHHSAQDSAALPARPRRTWAAPSDAEPRSLRTARCRCSRASRRCARRGTGAPRKCAGPSRRPARSSASSARGSRR